MKRFLPVFIALLAGCRGNPPASSLAVATQPAKTQSYALYKFLQRIGMERSTFTPAPDGATEVKTTFSFNDRGTDVTLAALYRLASSGRLQRFEAWGTNARNVPYEVRVATAGNGFEVQQLGAKPTRVTPAGPFAAVAGYAPVVGQQLLVQTWLSAGRPDRLATLPEGRVAIQSRGMESFTVDGKLVALEHLALHGLVWGREDLWITDSGDLAGLVTRDAEFDHFEAVRIDLTPVVDDMVARAGADAVAWLAETVQSPRRGGALALVGARLVDGTGAPAIDDAVVVIDGDRIVSAGRRATPLPDGVEQLHLEGKTIIPGLWDMHAHVEQVEQMAAYLAAGVTSVRDVGNILPFITSIRDAIASGSGVGPRVLVDPLIDGEGRRALGTLLIAAEEDIGPMLDRAQKAGATEIKIYSSMKRALLAPLCAEAHRRGLKVTGHVPFGMNAIEAVKAGYHGINHIDYVLDLALPSSQAEIDKLSRPEVAKRKAAADLEAPVMQQFFALAVEKHITFDPTLALFELFSLPLAELERNEPGLMKMPAALHGFYPGVTPEQAEVSRAIFRKDLEIVRELHKRGVPIVAGTDIGVPGYSLDREIELYVEAGFTPMEAIQAATLVPARSMGKEAELGTVVAGKRADLVVIDGDPLADITTSARSPSCSLEAGRTSRRRCGRSPASPSDGDREQRPSMLTFHRTLKVESTNRQTSPAFVHNRTNTV